MSNPVILSPRATWYISEFRLEVQSEFARAALAIPNSDFQKELTSRGFKTSPTYLALGMNAAEDKGGPLSGSFVFSEEEGALVRAISSWGATLARDPEIRTIEQEIKLNLPINYTATNHGSSKAPKGLLARCRDYVSIVEKLTTRN